MTSNVKQDLKNIFENLWFLDQKLDSCFYSELPESASLWEVMHNWTTLIHVLHVSCSVRKPEA